MWGTAKSLVFDPATGKLTTPADPFELDLTAGELGTGGYANAVDITVSLADLTQFGDTKTLTSESQNGFAMGTLQSYSISKDGVITGVFSNGLTQDMGQIALASFTNPVGLEKAGGSSYRATVNSGLASVGSAGAARQGHPGRRHASRCRTSTSPRSSPT